MYILLHVPVCIQLDKIVEAGESQSFLFILFPVYIHIHHTYYSIHNKDILAVRCSMLYNVLSLLSTYIILIVMYTKKCSINEYNCSQAPSNINILSLWQQYSDGSNIRNNLMNLICKINF